MAGPNVFAKVYTSMFRCGPTNIKKKKSFQVFDVDSEVSEVKQYSTLKSLNLDNNSLEKINGMDPTDSDKLKESQGHNVGQSLRKHKKEDAKKLENSEKDSRKHRITDEFEKIKGVDQDRASSKKDKMKKKEQKESTGKKIKDIQNISSHLSKKDKDRHSKKKVSISERLSTLNLNSESEDDRYYTLEENRDIEERSNADTEISCVIDLYDKDRFNKVLAKKMASFILKNRRK